MIRKNIKYLCKTNNVKVRDLEKELNIKNNGLSRDYFYNSIKLATIQKIANKFSVPLILLINCDLKTMTREDIYDIFEEGVLYEFSKRI